MNDDDKLEIPNYLLYLGRANLVNHLLKDMTDRELTDVVSRANNRLYDRLYYLKKKLDEVKL